MNPIFKTLGTAIYDIDLSSSEIICNNPSIKLESFWEYINILQWTDKSDGFVNISNIDKLLKLLRANIFNFNKIFNLHLTKLKRVYVQSNHFFIKNELSDIKIKSFLGHIIAKGYIFYLSVLNYLQFSDYLINDNEYRDIYSICQFLYL